MRLTDFGPGLACVNRCLLIVVAGQWNDLSFRGWDLRPTIANQTKVRCGRVLDVSHKAIVDYIIKLIYEMS